MFTLNMNIDVEMQAILLNFLIVHVGTILYETVTIFVLIVSFWVVLLLSQCLFWLPLFVWVLGFVLVLLCNTFGPF